LTPGNKAPQPGGSCKLQQLSGTSDVCALHKISGAVEIHRSAAVQDGVYTLQQVAAFAGLQPKPWLSEVCGDHLHGIEV
jgi:hypothetical protein